jgi:hypothetical protein
MQNEQLKLLAIGQSKVSSLTLYDKKLSKLILLRNSKPC